MRKKPVRTQQKILEVLEDLEQREGKEWWDVLIIILMIYRPQQIDPQHEKNKERIGFRRDWTHTKAEKVAVIRAILNLEKKGMIESRIIRTRDNPILEKKRISSGSYVSSWKEIRLKR